MEELDNQVSLQIEAECLNARQFSEILHDEKILNGYVGTVRLIMCYSARGGRDSFANKLSRLINLPVKGYRHRVYPVIDDLISTAMPPSQDMLLKQTRRVRAIKLFRPADYGMLRYALYRVWGGIDAYAPQTFYPVGNITSVM